MYPIHVKVGYMYPIHLKVGYMYPIHLKVGYMHPIHIKVGYMYPIHVKVGYMYPITAFSTMFSSLSKISYIEPYLLFLLQMFSTLAVNSVIW